MVNFTSDQLRSIMGCPRNIRCISVVAHVDHGKSTLTDSLVSKAGIISAAKAGDARFTDGREDEQQRGITIKSTGVSLVYQIPDPFLSSEEGKQSNATYLINLIDSPGHVDFSSEVTAALRVTDGALVVVDCVEGVCVQTDTVLRQSLVERVKPVLMINKMDRAFLELQLDPEAAYQTFLKTVESVNVVIATYTDPSLGDLQLSPDKGNVCFGSGYHQWGFSLETFANLYAAKHNTNPKKLVSKLWGDNFWDAERRQWCSDPREAAARGLERGFNKFVYEPLSQLVRAISSGDIEALQRMLSGFGVQFSAAAVEKGDKGELGGRALMKAAMGQFLPLADALLNMIVVHLPSPLDAQKYRIETLYQGPMDDECAVAMRECDPTGPLMMYVSKMVPSENSGRFYAFGRIFSGTVRSGVPLRILGNAYSPDKKADVHEKPIQRTVVMMGRFVEVLGSVPCGNTCAVLGIDQHLTSTGTITDSPHAHAFKPMLFSVSPVVRVAIEPKKAADLPKLLEGLKRLSKSDPCVEVRVEDSGEHVVAAVGELHLEICLNDLRNTYAGVDFNVSQPLVPLRETVSTVSSQVCLSKSPNKLNRLWCTAQPLPDGLAQAIDARDITARDDVKARAKVLSERFGMEVAEARKIWCFGPDSTGPNLLVDTTKGVMYLNEVKDSIVTGFGWATSSGVLCDEPLRNVRVNVVDVSIVPDATHRPSGQFIPTTRRAVFASVLTAQPRVCEPVYLVEIQVPRRWLGCVYNVLSKRRGVVVSEESRCGTPLCSVKADLPVLESFGFSAALRAATGGTAFPQCVFDHWQMMPSDPLEPGTQAHSVVTACRERKGLLPTVPALGTFLDKL